jgi:hypothetical protein
MLEQLQFSQPRQPVVVGVPNPQETRLPDRRARPSDLTVSIIRVLRLHST